MTFERVALGDRFWPKVIRDPETECWEWTARRNPEGYGRVHIGGVKNAVPAHRVAYELTVGPIPAGLYLDHLCRNPGCVNPAHLEAVTNGENVLRGVGRSAANARKTHCKHGHPFDEANTYRYAGARNCRTCHADLERRRRHERPRA